MASAVADMHSTASKHRERMMPPCPLRGPLPGPTPHRSRYVRPAREADCVDEADLDRYAEHLSGPRADPDLDPRLRTFRDSQLALEVLSELDAGRAAWAGIKGMSTEELHGLAFVAVLAQKRLIASDTDLAAWLRADWMPLAG